MHNVVQLQHVDEEKEKEKEKETHAGIISLIFT